MKSVNEEFLNGCDLIVYYNHEPKKLLKDYVVLGGEDEFSKVDIPKTSKKLPLLLGRLAYVFEIYDKELEKSEEFEDFVEGVLKGIRVKKEIQNHETTLENIAGVLYLMEKSQKIGIIAGEIEEEEMENLISFLKMLKSECGIYTKADLSGFDFEFYGI